MATVPENDHEARLIYKTVGAREVELLFFPPLVRKEAKAPLFIIIPGGGWTKSVAIDMYNMERRACDALRQEGYAVASLSYRNNSEPGIMMPQIVADVFDAAGYLARYAGVLGVDPMRIVTSGHSAGGHLALMMAYGDKAEVASLMDYPDEEWRVIATAPMSPPTTLRRDPDRTYLNFSTERYFVGCPATDFARFSPLEILTAENAVPTLMAVGASDALVYPVNGEEVCKKLDSLGVRNELVVSEHGGHCFEPIDAPASDPNLAGVEARIVEFVKSL